MDADLKALREKAKELKAKHLAQLGALVVATGADVLAGLLIAASLKPPEANEAWRSSRARRSPGSPPTRRRPWARDSTGASRGVKGERLSAHDLQGRRPRWPSDPAEPGSLESRPFGAFYENLLIAA
jgi:hypothetical protein